MKKKILTAGHGHGGGKHKGADGAGQMIPGAVLKGTFFSMLYYLSEGLRLQNQTPSNANTAAAAAEPEDAATRRYFLSKVKFLVSPLRRTMETLALIMFVLVAQIQDIFDFVMKYAPVQSSSQNNQNKDPVTIETQNLTTKIEKYLSDGNGQKHSLLATLHLLMGYLINADWKIHANIEEHGKTPTNRSIYYEKGVNPFTYDSIFLAQPFEVCLPNLNYLPEATETRETAVSGAGKTGADSGKTGTEASGKSGKSSKNRRGSTSGQEKDPKKYVTVSKTKTSITNALQKWIPGWGNWYDEEQKKHAFSGADLWPRETYHLNNLDMTAAAAQMAIANQALMRKDRDGNYLHSYYSLKRDGTYLLDYPFFETVFQNTMWLKTMSTTQENVDEYRKTWSKKDSDKMTEEFWRKDMKEIFRELEVARDGPGESDKKPTSSLVARTGESSGTLSQSPPIITDGLIFVSTHSLAIKSAMEKRYVRMQEGSVLFKPKGVGYVSRAENAIESSFKMATQLRKNSCQNRRSPTGKKGYKIKKKHHVKVKRDSPNQKKGASEKGGATNKGGENHKEKENYKAGQKAGKKDKDRDSSSSKRSSSSSQNEKKAEFTKPNKEKKEELKTKIAARTDLQRPIWKIEDENAKECKLLNHNANLLLAAKKKGETDPSEICQPWLDHGKQRNFAVVIFRGMTYSAGDEDDFDSCREEGDEEEEDEDDSDDVWTETASSSSSSEGGGPDDDSDEIIDAIELFYPQAKTMEVLSLGVQKKQEELYKKLDDYNIDNPKNSKDKDKKGDSGKNNSGDKNRKDKETKTKNKGGSGKANQEHEMTQLTRDRDVSRTEPPTQLDKLTPAQDRKQRRKSHACGEKESHYERMYSSDECHDSDDNHSVTQIDGSNKSRLRRSQLISTRGKGAGRNNGTSNRIVLRAEQYFLIILLVVSLCLL